MATDLLDRARQRLNMLRDAGVGTAEPVNAPVPGYEINEINEKRVGRCVLCGGAVAPPNRAVCASCCASPPEPPSPGDAKRAAWFAARRLLPDITDEELQEQWAEWTAHDEGDELAKPAEGPSYPLPWVT
jgi:hypothetical protein